MTDELVRARAAFPALDTCCHLVSHSLGCLPAKAYDHMQTFLDLWHRKSVTAWEDWLPELDRAAARIERLLSAAAGTVTMLTNVSQVMSIVTSCFDYPPARNKIVYASVEFPTVSYLMQGETRRGAEIHVIPSRDGFTVDTEALIAAIDERTALVPLSHAVDRSGALVDVRAIAARAKQVGAHVVLDAFQTVGALPIDVVDLGVAFACGGALKYLCGGPGAAFLYVRPDLIAQLEPRVTGWFAHEAPFAFEMPSQRYAEGIWRFQGGTPAVAALYQARAGLELVSDLGARAIREHGVALGDRAIAAIEARGFTLRTPREPARRGASLVFDFAGAAEVARELGHRRYFCDHRPGAGLRIAPHFYNTEGEIDDFFAELDAVRRGTAA